MFLEIRVECLYKDTFQPWEIQVKDGGLQDYAMR